MEPYDPARILGPPRNPHPWRDRLLITFLGPPVYLLYAVGLACVWWVQDTRAAWKGEE